MCLLIIQGVMLVSGLWAAVTGKLPAIVLGTKYSIEGPAARIVGIILALPLPLTFMLGLIVAIASGGADQYGGLVTLTGIVSMIVALIAARIISRRAYKSTLGAGITT
jgi:hypothetical protein